jgi:uncharacterized protein (TIGR03435 family)
MTRQTGAIFFAGVFASMGAISVRAQSRATAAKPQFEVASVRLSVPVLEAGANARQGGGGGPVCPTRFSMDGGRVDIECLTLAALIGHAFGILPDRIAGPDWMTAGSTAKFDIAANLPEGASAAQVPEMLQALLADRFKLAIHREKREQTVYALVVAKSGLKAKSALPKADAPSAVTAADPNTLPAQPSTIANIGGGEAVMTDLPSQNGRGATTITSPLLGTVRTTVSEGVEHLEAPNTTFEGLAGLMSTMMVAPVAIVDRTGLKGRYQVVLEISWQEVVAAGQAAQAQEGGRATDPASEPAIVAAQLNQFRRELQKAGLRLEPRKGPVEIIVVDHLEKTPTGN